MKSLERKKRELLLPPACCCHAITFYVNLRFSLSLSLHFSCDISIHLQAFPLFRRHFIHGCRAHWLQRKNENSALDSHTQRDGGKKSLERKNEIYRNGKEEWMQKRRWSVTCACLFHRALRRWKKRMREAYSFQTWLRGIHIGYTVTSHSLYCSTVLSCKSMNGNSSTDERKRRKNKQQEKWAPFALDRYRYLEQAEWWWYTGAGMPFPWWTLRAFFLLLPPHCVWLWAITKKPSSLNQ